MARGTDRGPRGKVPGQEGLPGYYSIRVLAMQHIINLNIIELA